MSEPLPPTDVVVSSDTQRENRVPPGQHRTAKWPVLHVGEVPDYGDLSTWSFSVTGLVERPLKLSWPAFQQLPRVRVCSDIHCVTTWTRLDNLWEGPATRTLMELAGVKPTAAFVIAHAEHGFTANVPMDHFADGDALCALLHDGQPLTPEHGFPVRLVVPKLYFWKSAKWLRGLEFVDRDFPGYWEMNGYHMRGDPWTQQRYS